MQDLKELVDSSLDTTGQILQGAHTWDLRREAIKMCLYACGHMTPDEGCEIMSQLVKRTIKAVERTIMIEAAQGVTVATVFGCRKNSGYSKEISVSTCCTITMLSIMTQSSSVVPYNKYDNIAVTVISSNHCHH